MFKAEFDSLNEEVSNLKSAISNEVAAGYNKLTGRNKKRQYIYLAGNISENPETYAWRDQFIDILSDVPNVIIINPCASKFNQNMKGSSNNGLDFVRRAKKISHKLLRPKDYQLIKMCSVMVTHLGFVSPEKPLIGTLHEMVWAHDIFYIPLLAITNNEDNAYTNHPWIDECCSAKVETVEEAAELIRDFFLGY